MKRKLTCLICLFCCVLFICSCAKEQAPIVPQCTPLAPPAHLSIGSAVKVALYFLSASGDNIQAENRKIFVYNNKTPLESILEELLNGPHTTTLTSPLTGTYSLERAEISDNVCNVFLYGNPAAQPNIEVLLGIQATICATLHDFFGINYLNLFINKCPVSYNGFALGAFEPLKKVSLHDYIDARKAELNSSTNMSGYITYYVPHTTTGLLHAKTKSITFARTSSNTQRIKLILSQFKAYMRDYFPLDNSLFTFKQTTKDNMHVLTVKISNLENSCDIDKLKASLTLTLTTFITDIDRIQISANDDSVTCTSDCLSQIGTSFKVYYPYLLNDVLTEKQLSLASTDLFSLKECVGQMLSNSNKIGILYPTFSKDDCLSVYINNGMAVVNLSNAFWESFTQFTSEGWSVVENSSTERLVIYGIVNTLTALPYVSSVLFLRNGKNLGTLGKIYLGLPLYRNVGLLFEG